MQTCKITKLKIALELKKYLVLHTLKTIYFANFQSLLRFGVIFWGQFKNININVIFVDPKSCARTLRF